MLAPSPIQVLVVDDMPDICTILDRRLRTLGLDVTIAHNGVMGLAYAQRDRPRLIIVDWLMPGLNGPNFCQQVRNDPELQSTYLLMLTAHSGPKATTEALDAGADEFLSKPIDEQELLARVRAGLRIANLHADLTANNAQLSEKIVELNAAMTTISRLEGLLPICAQCKMIRLGDRSWEPIETYVKKRSQAEFTHSLCEPCLSLLYPTFYPAEATRT